MFTVSFVLYEKAGIPRTEALRYWREEHAPIVKQVPGLRRYTVQLAVGAPEGEPPFLGLASLGFDDREAFAAAGLAMTRWWTDPAGDFGLSLSVPV